MFRLHGQPSLPTIFPQTTDMPTDVDETGDLNYSDLVLTVGIFSLCKDERTYFM